VTTPYEAPARTFRSASLAERPAWFPARPAGVTITDGDGDHVYAAPEDLLGSSELAQAAAGFRFATDKVYWHGYFSSYQRLAGQIGPAGRVCEIGVWRGDSLAMWQALFPGGLVAGVDHDPDAVWPPGTARVVAAQDDPGLPARLRELSACGFDLIVDDASHDGTLTRATWDLLWPLVRPGGFYVVEDWQKGMGVGGGQAWAGSDDSMLRCAEGFLRLLDSRDCDPDCVEYRYGLAILHRRG
jgi:Methyltransferase domain